MQRQLIFLPHIIALVLRRLLQLFLLAIQAVEFLVQIVNVFGHLFLFLEKSSIRLRHLFTLFLPFFQFPFQLGMCCV